STCRVVLTDSDVRLLHAYGRAGTYFHRTQGAFSMSAETPVQSAGTFTRMRLRFRGWRGARPFWAGLFTLLGGIPIAYLPYATLKLGHMSLAMATTAGAGSLIIGVLLFTLGLTMWFQSATRVFAGVAAILLAL